MSHKAVNWALDQNHLKPAPWVVLIQLADRHNKDTLRVDPEQKTLAADCNMSRSTVNGHLAYLEEIGLLVRVRRVNPQTKKQESTFYILGIDFANPPFVENAVSDYRTRIEEVQNGNKSHDHVQKPDTEAESGKSAFPSPENSDSRVRKPDTNHGIEPGKEPCASEADPQNRVFDNLLAEFISAYPRIGKPAQTEKEFRKAIAAGADPDQIIAAARAYADEQSGNKRQFIAMSENWLNDRRWETFDQPASEKTGGEAVKSAKIDADVRAIKSGIHAMCQKISTAQALAMIRAELITVEEARRVDLVTMKDCQNAGVVA